MKIIGNIEIQGSELKVNNKNVIRSINTINSDENGNIEISYYKKNEILELMSSIPVSRYETLNYLPLSVSGSYEGATLLGSVIMPILVENDGTITWLRRGTNGSSTGFYYNYQNNVHDYNEYKPVVSTTKYSLIGTDLADNFSFFTPSNFKEVMVPKLNISGKYAVIKTSGTLNNSSHTYAIISIQDFVNTSEIIYSFFYEDYCYFIGVVSGDNTTASMGFTFHRMLISEINNNETSNIEQITGMNGTGIFGKQYNNIDIIQACRYRINNATVNGEKEDCFYNYDNGITVSFIHNGWIKGQNIFYIKDDIMTFSWDNNSFLSTANSRGNKGMGLRFRLNMKTFDFEFDTRDNSEPTYIRYINEQIVLNPNTFPEYSYYNNSERVSPCFIGEEAIVAIVCGIQAPQNYQLIYRKVVTDNVLNWNSTLSEFSSYMNGVTVSPQFGSPIGNFISNPHFLSKDKIIFCSNGRNNAGNFSPYGAIISSRFEGEPNFNYKSAFYGNILGYKPNVDRQFIESSSLYGKYSFYMGIYDDSTDTIINHNTWYCSFQPNYTMELNIDPETLNGTPVQMDTTGFNVMTESIIDDILSEFPSEFPIASKGASIYHDPETNVGYGYIEIFFTAPVGGINLYRFAFDCKFDFIDNTFKNYTKNNHYLQFRNSGYLGIGNANDRQFCSGLVKYKIEDTWYIMYVPGLTITNSGDTHFNSVICELNPDGTMKLPLYRIVSYRTSAYNSPNRKAIGYLPGSGVGVFQMSYDLTDFSCKCIFRLYGNTKQDNDNFLSETTLELPSQVLFKKDIVICSQDVPEEFNVYFNESVPAFLNGRFATLEPTSFNLSEMFTSVYNNTFYVYIVQSGSAIQYEISNLQLPETPDRMYIGYIVTGNDGIDSINIEKTSRFDLYRPSFVPRGAAFPVSSGVPTGTGTRWN